jgi:hypothetical protein
MSARAVAVIRPAPIIIALALFLCILAGKCQLHTSKYLFQRKGPFSRFVLFDGIVIEFDTES